MKRITLLVAIVHVLILGVVPLHAATFRVNFPQDEVDNLPGDGKCETASGWCTLRAAIQEANALPGPDSIILDDSTYLLTIPGTGEDACATGDLDITDDLVIKGFSRSETHVYAGGIDRVFHIVGPIKVEFQDLSIEEGEIRDENGAGILNSGGTVTIKRSILMRNTVESQSSGGGISNDAKGTMEIFDSAVSYNRSWPGNATGVSNEGTMSLTRCAVNDNYSGGSTAGGIKNNGLMTLTECTVSDNWLEYDEGGGILNNGVLKISKSVISGNTAWDGGGGGICNTGELLLFDSSVKDNMTAGSSGHGGAILNRPTGSVSISNSTISGNYCSSDGYIGGIDNDGFLEITDSTVANNKTDGEGAGGIGNSGTLALRSVTLSGNSAARNAAGGIENKGTLIIGNTILTQNISSSNPDCSNSGTLASLGHNLITDPGSCAAALVTSDLSGDAGLGSFADSTTPGRGYFPVLPGSKVVDAGDDAQCQSEDQLRNPRADGNGDGVIACDIGAVEFQRDLALAPTMDATISSEFPRRNFGLDTRLETDASPGKNFLMQFSVAGIAERQVESAVLYLYCIDKSNKGGNFHKAANDWSEQTVTWNTAPQYDSAIIASLGAVLRNTWVTVDVTPLITGDGVYSLLTNSTSSDGADYRSREVPDFAPRLEIVLKAEPAADLKFVPEADAYVREYSPSENYGTKYNLLLQSGSDTRSAYKGYLKFTVTGIAGAVEKAVLRVYAYNGSVDPPPIFATSNNWLESTITWSNAPDAIGPALSQPDRIYTSSWSEYDVTSAVTGNGTFSFLLPDFSTDFLGLYSREGTYPPELVLTPANP